MRIEDVEVRSSFEDWKWKKERKAFCWTLIVFFLCVMSFTAHSVCASRRQMPQCVERPLLLFPYHPLFDVYTPIAHVDPSYIHKSTVHILFVPKMKVSFLSFFVCVCVCSVCPWDRQRSVVLYTKIALFKIPSFYLKKKFGWSRGKGWNLLCVYMYIARKQRENVQCSCRGNESEMETITWSPLLRPSFLFFF